MNLLRDLRYAARCLRQAPGFTAAAVISLALGIGATTAIFTVANATILAPPPYPDPDRLLVLTTPDGAAGSTQQELTAIRDGSRIVASVAAQRSTPGWTLVSGSHAEYVEGLEITERYFETFGTRLLLGRDILASEAMPGGERAAIISDPLWRRVFGGRPAALGSVITLGGRRHTIVGIAPASFRSSPPADVWVSMQIPATSNAANQLLFGRVAEGRTRAEVLAELDALRASVRSTVTSPGRAARVNFITWMPYRDWITTGTRALVIRVLLGAVLLLLVLACVNVAALQIARGVQRSRDLTTRAALGSGHWRLFREPLLEAALIACCGAAIGLAVGAAGVRGLLLLMSGDVATELFAGNGPSLDGRVLGFTVLTAMFAAMLSGIAPAVHAVARRPLSPQPAKGVTASRTSVWLRRSFVTAQVSLAVVLLVGSGLLIRTFATLRGVELGFDPSSIVVGELSVPASGYDTTQRNAFIADVVQHVGDIEGVRSVSISNRVPVDVSVNLAVRALGTAKIAEPRSTDWSYVTEAYFQQFEIPLRAGRLFDVRDDAPAPPVAIVNEAFALAFFGHVNVVGESIQTRILGEPERQVIGVVGDTRSRSNADWTRGLTAHGSGSPPIVYVPAAQASLAAFQTVHAFTPMRVIATFEGSGDIAPAMQDAVRAVDPTRAFIRFLSMDQIISRDLDLQRVLMTLVTTFSLIAFALAITGIYALVSFSAAQRTREAGVRMALGANRRRLLIDFVREGMAAGGIGLLVGLLGSMLATRALAAFLVGVAPTDRVNLLMVSVVFMFVAAIASLIPANRAASINPMEALRIE